MQAVRGEVGGGAVVAVMVVSHMDGLESQVWLALSHWSSPRWTG